MYTRILWLALLLLGIPSGLALAQGETPSGSEVGLFQRERKLYPTINPRVRNFDMHRQAMQDRIASGLFQPGQVSEQPRIIFTAGGMGVGKTRVLEALGERGYFDPEKFVRIDPDFIREQIPEYAKLLANAPAEAAAIVQPEAAYISELAFERALAEHRNIVLDSSMRHSSYFHELVLRLRKTHPEYRIEILHVEAEEKRILERVRARAQKIGRRPSDELVRESILDSRRSVQELAPIVDQVMVIENNDAMSLRQVQRGLSVRQENIPLSGATGKLERFISQTAPRTSGDNPLHIVFDLDWTILSELRPDTTAPAKRTIVALGKRYYVSEGIEEMIEALLKNPRVKVSFYSGGELGRNLEALQAILLPDGRSLFDIAYRVFSKDDLVPSNMPGVVGMPLKKDLRRIAPDLRNIVLADDIADYALQPGHTFWLGKTYNPFRRFEDTQYARLLMNDARYIPRTPKAWLNDRLKLYRLYGALSAAIDKATKEGVDLATAALQARDNFSIDEATARGLRLLGHDPKAEVCMRVFQEIGFLSKLRRNKEEW